MFTTDGRMRSMSGASVAPTGTCGSPCAAGVEAASWKSGMVERAGTGVAAMLSREQASAPTAAVARRILLKIGRMSTRLPAQWRRPSRPRRGA